MKRRLPFLVLLGFFTVAGCSNVRETYNDAEDEVQETGGEVLEGTTDTYDAVEDEIQDEGGDVIEGAEEAYDDVEDELQGEDDNVVATAVAEIQPINDSDVMGTITFTQMGDHIMVNGTVNGLADGKHGIHVHEGTSCENRGGHFSPMEHPHGSPHEPSDDRHVGDLGNLVVEDGVGEYEGLDRVLSLTESGRSIVGRVVVIHAGEDEFIPQPSGSSGTEIGCGVITMQ